MTEPVGTPIPEPTTELEPADDSEPMTLGEARKLRREHAGLRSRLKAAEADNERLITQQAAAERREIEREAASVLVDPQDIWLHTSAEEQQAFVDSEFHEISRDRVVDAARALAESKPHLARPVVTPPPTQQPVEGLRPGASPEQPKPAATWFGAIRGS